VADAKKPKPKKPPAPRFEYPEPVAGINRLPADDHEVSDAVCRDLVAGGAERIEQLVGLVGEFGDDKGVKPKYALHALASYCSRAKAEAERKLFAATLARQLNGEHSPSVKAFLIRQLQLAGTPAEVAALSKHLPDQRLGLPAIQALVAIGDETAVAALRAALPASRGRHRVGIIQGLGRHRDGKAVPTLLEDAKTKDRDIRLAALYALGNIGDAAATQTLQAAIATASPYERSQAVDACLLLAQRLREQGKSDEAKAIYKHLLDTCAEPPDDKHVRHAAQEGLDALTK
jgi:HEAT repeat protein